MSFDRSKYFERIGYTNQPSVSVETLREIHAAQVFSIPFENLSIHESKNVNNQNDFIALDEASLFKKLVIDKRGGYCHENNELLAIALTQIGFQVERLAARVLTAPNLPRGHKLLLVTINDQKWIADVGFGGYGLYEPIPLVVNQEEKQYGDYFKIVMSNDIYVLQFLQNSTWKNLYEFNLEKFEPVDFKPFSYHVSHAPDSFFVQNRFCVMPTPQGRMVLLNEKLRIMNNGQEEVKMVEDETNYFAVLKQYFGIALPENTQLKKLNSITENKNERNTSNTSHWCNYFTKAAMVAGIVGTMYLSDKVIKASISNNI
jgi:N-hydroxyarylamine O-acetyltransferase